MAKSSPPTASFAIERFTLDNGLRVVLSPDRSSPTVCIAVYYDVGFRSEPQGRTGFAHLFEHLMFEGSATLEKMQHAHLVQANGGVLNGSTRPDFTNYFEQLPSSALELGLFLEADRMRAVRLSEETLRNQIDVVKEEIRVNVLNQPYGGVPFIELPPVLFDTWNNSHNGYGSFEDLERATIKDAADFSKRYYAPGNAVLTVVGDLDVAKTREMVERLFGDIPARKVPKRPSFAEPRPDRERRKVHPDRLAQVPQLVVGYRIPDPIKAFEELLACVLLADVLADGDASRLHTRLVKRDQLASHVFAYFGMSGAWWEQRDPSYLQVIAYHQGDVDGVLGAIDEEVDAVAAGIDEAELDRVKRSAVSGYLRNADNLIFRTMTISVLEQQRGQAELINEIPALLSAVPAEDVAKAASTWLTPTSRAVLDVQPAPQTAGGAA